MRSVARARAPISCDLIQVVTAPTDAGVGFQLANDGTVYTDSTNPVSFPATNAGAWLIPGSNSSNYEVRVTRTGGTAGVFTTGDNTAAWLNLGTSRSWSLVETGANDSTIVFTIEIRRASDSVVVSTKTGNQLEAVTA